MSWPLKTKFFLWVTLYLIPKRWVCLWKLQNFLKNPKNRLLFKVFRDRCYQFISKTFFQRCTPVKSIPIIGTLTGSFISPNFSSNMKNATTTLLKNLVKKQFGKQRKIQIEKINRNWHQRERHSQKGRSKG